MCDMNLRVVLRSGIGEPRNTEAVDDIEQRDRDLDIPSVTENRETQGSKTTPWQSIPEKVPRSQQTKLWSTTAVSPDQRLRRSRVLHSSAGLSTSSHVAVNYHKMELEEENRRQVAHEAARF